MIKKLPINSVEIGGRTITLVVEELDSWGEYRSDERQIAFSHKAVSTIALFIETLRHEMGHAALDMGGISHLKNYEEEAIIRCFDTIFHPAWDRVRELILESLND